MKHEIPVRIRNLGTQIDPEPVFIFGNYKTGSTAIASLLAIGTGQTLTSDTFCKAPSAVKRRLLRKEIPLEWFVHHYRYFFSKKIVKEPDLIFYLDQLETLFPKSQFVFLLRDPRENIRSILNFLKLPGSLKDLSQHQLESLPGNIWILAIEGTLFGTQGNNYIATQARRWNRILEIYEQYSEKTMLMTYESFKQDKIRAIHSLAEQLNLRITADISPYLNVQYQPKGDHSVNWLDFYGPDNLACIESICAEKMEQYGYKCLLPGNEK